MDNLAYFYVSGNMIFFPQKSCAPPKVCINVSLDHEVRYGWDEQCINKGEESLMA